MDIKITPAPANKIAVASPFHPDWSEKARGLGGRWDAAGKAWTFDARDEVRVREALVATYGTDGSPTELVTIRFAVGGDPNSGFRAEEKDLWVAGVRVLYRGGRDWAIQLGTGVVQVEGDALPPSGGSVKNPRLAISERRVFELRDVPKAAALKEISEYGYAVSLVAPETDEKAARKTEISARIVALEKQIAELTAELTALA